MARLHPTANNVIGGVAIDLRCPYCHHLGIFTPHPQVVDLISRIDLTTTDGLPRVEQIRSGIRICPNRACRSLVFITADDDAKFTSYPPERIDFDPDQIPHKILNSFEEAITNHASHCFRSAAIMIRRTLEEVCADRGAIGPSLKCRIKALRKVIIVPEVLLDAADELRLLGNDAAHLEARVYDEIGKDEVEIAIRLTKEILKAVYQFSSLVDQLRNLKK